MSPLDRAVVCIVATLKVNRVNYITATAAAARLAIGMSLEAGLDRETFLQSAREMWDWEAERREVRPLIEAGVCDAHDLTNPLGPGTN